MARFRITVTSEDREAMLDLVRKHKIQVSDHGARSIPGGYEVHAIAEAADIDRLEKAGYRVQRHEDIDVLGRQRQAEVGQGDRYKPTDPGKKPQTR